jgi:hypothetical protein
MQLGHHVKNGSDSCVAGFARKLVGIPRFGRIQGVASVEQPTTVVSRWGEPLHHPIVESVVPVEMNF